MKSFSKILLILLVMATLAQNDAATKRTRVNKKPGRYRPRSPQQYIVKCCSGSCWNPSKSNKSYITKIRANNSALTTLLGNNKLTTKTLRIPNVSAATTLTDNSAQTNSLNTVNTRAPQTMQSTGQADDDVSLLKTKIEAAADTGGTTIFTAQTGETNGYERTETGNTASNNSAASSQTSATSIPATSKNETSITTPSSIATPVSANYTITQVNNPSVISSTEASSTTTATITTTKPKCVMPECSDFKKANLSSKAAVSGGKKIQACGRNYFIADSTETLSNAASFCASMNMSLLSLESIAELFCLLKMMPATTRTLKFWTSGANDGAFCDEQGVYAWCTKGEVVPTGLLTAFTKASTSASERCLQLDAAGKDNSSALLHSNCTLKVPYICEPQCQQPKCPSGCAKNASLFNAQGKVDKPESFGMWMETCGDVYLFGNKPVTWQKNVETCCSLGMVPFIMDSAAEQECLSKMTKSSNWTGNHNYWTGGTQQDCRGSWGWCGGAAPRGVLDDVKWDAGQPDNLGGRQDCVHLKNVKDIGLRLTDRNCTDKYILACKGNPEAKPAIKIPDCPSNACNKNSSLFTGTSLNNYHSYGKWLAGCGKYFMFSSAKATWKAARDMCCSIGLTLATVQTHGKRNCMAKTADELEMVDGEDFWVYGTDSGSNGNFHWCSTAKEFEPREIAWAPGEPNSNFHCVYVKNKGVNQTVLATADCDTEKRFLCDVRKKGTGGMAMQQECLEIWGVTESDIDLLQTNGVTSANYTYNLKCFLKCMGEYAGMFAFGGLVGSDALKMIEEASMNAPVEQLQNGFNAYDECSEKRYDDECVTAGEIYSCGRQKEPTIVDAIFNSEKGNATVFDPPIPCAPKPRRCVYEGKAPCVTDPTLRASYLATGMTPLGTNRTSTLKSSFFLTNYVSSSKHNLSFSFNYCCRLGMRLAEVVSAAEVSSVSSSIAASNGNTVTLVMGEVYNVNASHSAFCRTNRVFKHSEMCYENACAEPTCVDAEERNNLYFYIYSASTKGLRMPIPALEIRGFMCEEP